MIVQKSEVDEILQDIKAKYGRESYSVQGLKRFTTSQYANWEVDNVASDYKSILIGHFTINHALLRFLNSQLVANGSISMAINALIIHLASAGGNIQETNQIYNYEPGSATSIVTSIQNESIFVVSSSLRVAIGSVLTGAWFSYDGATFTFPPFYLWLNNLEATMLGWVTPNRIDALINFVGYECVISN